MHMCDYKLGTFLTRFIFIALSLWCSSSYAALHLAHSKTSGEFNIGESLAEQYPVLMFVAAESDEQSSGGQRAGALVIPGDEDEEDAKKKCMMICETWGEDCVINPRTGSRRCRRMCKQFGEECF